jgi:hypothetical protein
MSKNDRVLRPRVRKKDLQPVIEAIYRLKEKEGLKIVC